jgi:hypothetical protein
MMLARALVHTIAEAKPIKSINGKVYGTYSFTRENTSSEVNKGPYR